MSSSVFRVFQGVKLEALKAPATASDNGPGEWPHLDERHDFMNISADPRRGVA
jgi:hypothetical protein